MRDFSHEFPRLGRSLWMSAARLDVPSAARATDYA
jgi:hypothetical protein